MQGTLLNSKGHSSNQMSTPLENVLGYQPSLHNLFHLDTGTPMMSRNFDTAKMIILRGFFGVSYCNMLPFSYDVVLKTVL